MLQVHIPGGEFYDESTQTFVDVKPRTIVLEHSLLSVSRWESKWHKSYMNAENLSDEENFDYIRCMCIDQNIDKEILLRIPLSERIRIRDYITDSMTATTITNRKKDSHPAKKEIITSEIIYYWMVFYNIPFECEKWHLNRLLMLIQVCSIKEGSHEKMSRKDNLAMRRALNASRKAKTGSRG